ncbi:MAG: hypothetical protein Q9184_001969 [Pyrenodesmia sp. 2 TL-2023]
MSSSPSSFPSPSPIFFHRPSPPHGFLSQWYPTPFTSPQHPRITFTCAEQYMMYRKAILSRDFASASAILATPLPGQQKALGRKVRNFDAEAWERCKFEVVVEGNMYKFGEGGGGAKEDGKWDGQGKGKKKKKKKDGAEEVEERGERLREMLLATGERELFEASPRDRVWGIGVGKEVAEVMWREGDTGEWGQNLLGKALMTVRARLRVEEGVVDGVP